MTSACTFLSEEQFRCSICLEVFQDPVTIPCGHNFCKTCIAHHWDVSNHSDCPVCKDVPNARPELHTNTFISQMAAQFKHSALQRSRTCSVRSSTSTFEEVLCDVCTKEKQKALKSCLMCQTSYCETHLEPHHRIPGLKKHELIDPMENLEDRMCKSHDRLLELFCKTDQMCVCVCCLESDHKPHRVVPLQEEYERQKAELGEIKAKIKNMVKERRLKMEEMKQSVKISREEADAEKADSVQVFRSLIWSVEEGLNQLLFTIDEKQKRNEEKAEGFIKELEEEISELMKRCEEVEELSHTEDHLEFLQNFQSLNPAPSTKDWTEVSVHSSYEGKIRTVVAQLEEIFSKEVKKQLKLELNRVQQYSYDFTLDPDTASPKLILSDDRKQVKYGDAKQNLPENPKRFSTCACVLGKQGFPTGRFYFEVLVGEKTKWEVGVARESIDRHGHITLSPKNGFWAVWLRDGSEYRALAGPSVLLSLKSKPQKIGVFVDYEDGLVSFYDVDAAAHMYSFTDCKFTEKLFPYFRPCNPDNGKNSGPLIVSAAKVPVETSKERGSNVRPQKRWRIKSFFL